MSRTDSSSVTSAEVCEWTKGNAVWDPPLKIRTKIPDSACKIIVFWKKPEEWSELIYNWVVNTGQNRSIMTFFELTEGDLVQGTGECSYFFHL